MATQEDSMSHTSTAVNSSPDCSPNTTLARPVVSNDLASPSVTPVVSSASSSFSACDFLLDISNYIPAGCLRLERYKCQVTAEIWSSCDRWHWLGHPREIAFQQKGLFLQNVLQELFFNTKCLHPFRNLHQAGWIRLEFKRRDVEWGQIRVYILPEDIGRRMIDRADQALRRSLAQLMTELDMAKETWNARWSEETPLARIGAHVDAKDDEVSLFQLFNTLPSPSPNCDVVRDPYAKSAMENLLRGEFEGIKTTMLPYQRRSAAMMLQKEVEPGKIPDPRLLTALDQDGENFFCDITTGTCLRTPRMYEATRGGICAETMGLGKTLICLALILATKQISSQIPVEYSVGSIPVRRRVGSLLEMSAATIGRTGTPWKSFFDSQESDGSDYSQCKDAIRKNPGHYHIPGPVPRRASRNPVKIPPRKVFLSTATLIVVPANLVRQWQREIEKHTVNLKVLVVKDPKHELPPVVELLYYDIILFSRPRFEKESRDGSDDQGRRASSSAKHKADCYGGSDQNCSCFEVDKVYHSPLRDIHFKRLITDEGHTMGNSRHTAKTNAVIVVDFLQISSRWIVSGTPTPGLYGVDTSSGINDLEGVEDHESTGGTGSPRSSSGGGIDAEEERKDLEKLGNIATTYLKARPWANARYDENFASWSQYVMQPRHGSRSRGNIDCLRSTLEGMIIRHLPADVEKDIELPPLHQKVVYLEGSYLDKLSLNIFSLMITSNAITSERKDADYLFHPRQRKALGQLVANLRQASFFWSGTTRADIEATISIAKSFLSKGEVFTTDEDRSLLLETVKFGEIALLNSIWSAATEYHEMPFHIQNTWSTEVRQAWALDKEDSNPTTIGATHILALQKFVQSHIGKQTSIESIENAGHAARTQTRISSTATPISRSRAIKLQKKLGDSTPILAGGIRVAVDSSPKKKQPHRNLTIASPGKKSTAASISESRLAALLSRHSVLPDTKLLPVAQRHPAEASDVSLHATKSGKTLNTALTFTFDYSTLPATILSTASSKLSYLITEVLKYQKLEKIIIFYETDNVAYYIAQALEAINVEHLIYAKTLSSDSRSSYIVTFNQSIRFRVLLMDISQAAFGLDVSSASRVYFVNPVLNKQVEAQAVKRAHRIGQFRPVYVETLILRDSIEEVIIERRKLMSTDEQKKCKTVLDDQTMYDWIKNVRFVRLPPGTVPGPEQMAPLGSPQAAFVSRAPGDDGGEDIVLFSPKSSLQNKGKRKEFVAESSQSPSKKRQKRVEFVDEDLVQDQHTTPARQGVPSPSTHSSGIPLSEDDETSSPESWTSTEWNFISAGANSSSPSTSETSRTENRGTRSLLVKLKMDKTARNVRSKGSTSTSTSTSSSSSSSGSSPKSASGSGRTST